MQNIYYNVIKHLETKSLEEITKFLQSFSSQLGKKSLHCTDLIDQATKIPYITSILGSGLTVTNNTTFNPIMSEEIHQKAKSIIAYVKNHKNHNYSHNEIMFVLGYIELYYKKNIHINVA